MKIPITQQHIDAGERKSCGRCPAALAILDIPGVKGVQVCSYRIYLQDSLRRHSLKVPTILRRFIRDFDNGRAVRPITFDLPCEPCQPATTPVSGAAGGESTGKGAKP